MSLNSSRTRNRLIAAALLAGTALGGLGAAGLAGMDRPALAQEAGQIQPSQPARLLPDFVSLVRQVKPAVVSITSKIRDEQDDSNQGFGQQQMPFPFPFPFAQPRQQSRVIEARGSGFIIDADGTVVTNNHVVKNATSVTVTLDDGTTLPAKVIGRDARSDLAVLKVKSTRRLPFISLGDSGTVEPGEWVVAVGNPFGLGGSVTAGIVSARGRDIGEGPYDSFIQVDAPINQGNSGGPLFTQDGKVVGVNSAIISPSGGSVGIGFAIPSNTVKSVVAQLEKTGHVTRGFIGVQAQGVSAAMSGALHLPPSNSDDRGALVASVEPDSPASRAGVAPGDVIVGVNGHPIGNPRELAINVSEVPPGNHATLDLLRNGHARTVDVTVGTLSGESGSGKGAPAQAGQGLGLALSPITPQLRQQLDLADNASGAVITQVKPGSPAEQAGLQTGDVIVGVGDDSVSGPSDAQKAIKQQLKDSQAVALRILRNGAPLFVAISPSTDGSDQPQGDQGDNDDNG